MKTKFESCSIEQLTDGATRMAKDREESQVEEGGAEVAMVPSILCQDVA
eukprot:COSAG02_NODE_141_length_34311_cov_54.733135_17_plen_49_part_00